MRRITPSLLILLLSALLFSACEVPTPPPELPTPTLGSQNPENVLSRLALTPVIPTPERDFQPISAPPGHIYFVRDGQLWRITPGGKEEQRLASLQLSSPPQPSPDGKLVAFTSGNGVYVVSSGGGEPKMAAEGVIAEEQRLGWSPDSTMVGYVALDPTSPGTEQGWAVPVNSGGKPLLLTSLQESLSGLGPTYTRSVQWAPDARWVIVSGANNPMRVLRWPLSKGNDGDERDVAGGEPDWSPDSHTFVYAQTLNGSLVVYDAFGSGDTPFRNEITYVGTRLGEYGQGPGPRWSPASSGSDTDVLAYRSSAATGEPQVALRQRYGKELAPVEASSNNPSWSPGGGQLVVETGHLTQASLGKKWLADGLALVRVSVTGKQTVSTLVKNAYWPTWGK